MLIVTRQRIAALEVFLQLSRSESDHAPGSCTECPPILITEIWKNKYSVTIYQFFPGI